MDAYHVDSGLLQLLARALNPAVPLTETPSAETLWAIYQKAQAHDMAHLLFTSLDGLSVDIPPELLFKLRKKWLLAGSRYAQQSYELERITALFETNGIAYLPLKGTLLRELYPDPAMRTSCDIDILVHSEDLDKADELLCRELGYQPWGKSTHDVAYHGTSGVRLELHFDINEPDFRTILCFATIWEQVHLVEGSAFRYEMTPEHFVLYHIYHMAKHFAAGGCGIRPFMDLWVLKHRADYDEEKLAQLLREASLSAFARQAFGLCEVWFGGAQHTVLTREMEQYLIGAGIYGSRDNLVAIAQVKEGGKLLYFFRRVFLPFHKLKRVYPKLEKYPILYPWYQVKRWVSFLFRKNKKETLEEFTAGTAVTAEKRKSLKAMFTTLEL
ncbi:MAG: nucleotidyltransferase family protein [Clostridia bacterium]|nr:nucleotidyltransferase family protein [Clostridia bacterium]